MNFVQTKKQIFMENLSKQHKLFILSNLLTLSEFETSSLLGFYDEAKEENNTDKLLIYSHLLSIIEEAKKLLAKAKEIENI
jgi:hypothetical protein